MSHAPLLETWLSLLLPVLAAVYLWFDGVELRPLAELIVISLGPLIVLALLIGGVILGRGFIPGEGQWVFLPLSGLPLLVAAGLFYRFVVGEDPVGRKRMVLLFGMSYLGQVLFITGVLLFIIAKVQHSVV